MKRILPDRPLTQAERDARCAARHPNRAATRKKAYRNRLKREDPEKYKQKVKADNLRARSHPLYPERHARYMRKYRGDNLGIWLWRTAKIRAKRYDLAFDIDPSDVIVPEVCPVLGIPLSVGKGKVHDGSPTIDRKNNDLGYVKGNIIVVSWRANTIKSSSTPAELRRIADFYETLGI